MQWKSSLSFWRWRNGCADWGFIQTRHYRSELHLFLEQRPEGNTNSPWEYGTMKGAGKGNKNACEVFSFHPLPGSFKKELCTCKQPSNRLFMLYTQTHTQLPHTTIRELQTDEKMKQGVRCHRDGLHFWGLSPSPRVCVRILLITARTPEHRFLIAPQTKLH